MWIHCAVGLDQYSADVKLQNNLHKQDAQFQNSLKVETFVNYLGKQYSFPSYTIWFVKDIQHVRHLLPIAVS